MVLLSILASWALTPGKISGCLALGQIYLVNLGGNAFFFDGTPFFPFQTGLGSLSSFFLLTWPHRLNPPFSDPHVILFI